MITVYGAHFAVTGEVVRKPKSRRYYKIKQYLVYTSGIELILIY